MRHSLRAGSSQADRHVATSASQLSRRRTIAAMSNAPIPITVLGGYLGAGKTTMVNHLLTNAASRRIGVVVNDFGELGVDATLLGSAVEGEEGVPVVNLANGCVCCTLGDDLRATIQTLQEVRPRLDHIVIEASGVADPTTAAAWGTVPGFLPGGVIVLAAADSVTRMARDRYVGGEVVRQLEGADLVVLTKTDLVDDARARAVTAWIRTVVDAPIVPATNGELDVDVVLGVVHSRGSGPDTSGSTHRDSRRYVSWATATAVVSDDDLAAFVEHLPVGVLRAKGIVAVTTSAGQLAGRLMQVVGRTATITPWSVPSRGGIEVIGVRGVLDCSSLDALDADYLRHR